MQKGRQYMQEMQEMQELIENKAELLKKIWTKCKRPTEAEYKKLLFETEISMYEVNLIHAYQIDKALKSVSKEIANKANENGNYWWIDRFKKDFNKKDMGDDSFNFISRIDHAFRHLNHVCEFAGNYKNPYKYEYEWLIDFDSVLIERLESKYGFSGAKRSRQKSSQVDYLSQKYAGAI